LYTRKSTSSCCVLSQSASLSFSTGYPLAAGKDVNIKLAAAFSQGAKVVGALTWVLGAGSLIGAFSRARG
jgi:hypothetical protein